jgi:hypothetical protein
MTDDTPRFFTTDAEIRRIGVGLLERTLPRAEWTHEAHLAACLWIMTDRSDIDPDCDLRTIIGSYNTAVGGINDDTQGYHETITRCFVHAIRLHLSTNERTALVGLVNALLASAYGDRNWPLGFYSHDLLFSVAAWRDFVPPDLAPLPALC